MNLIKKPLQLAILFVFLSIAVVFPLTFALFSLVSEFNFQTFGIFVDLQIWFSQVDITAFRQFVLIFSVVVGLGITLLPNMPIVYQTLSSLNTDTRRIILYFLLIGLSLGVMTVSYWTGFLQGILALPFLHSALLNLGTEILGAGMLFIIIQGIWEKANNNNIDVKIDELHQTVEKLQAEIQILRKQAEPDHLDCEDSSNLIF